MTENVLVIGSGGRGSKDLRAGVGGVVLANIAWSSLWPTIWSLAAGVAELVGLRNVSSTVRRRCRCDSPSNLGSCRGRRK